MTKEELKSWLELTFPENKVEDAIDFPVLIVPKENLLSIFTQLVNTEQSKFNYLFCETAVDKQTHFEVIYHLTSTQYRHNMVVKVIIDDRENPEVQSVLSLFKSAELAECEIFDLFGIRFTNHSCRRLFLSDDWIGYPLRKDYKDDINVVTL